MSWSKGEASGLVASCELIGGWEPHLFEAFRIVCTVNTAGGGEQEGSGACCSSEAQSSGVQLRPPTQKMLPAAGREAPGSTSHGGADYQLVIEGVLGSGVESEEEVLG